jgi:uncharacterized surface protein with fasciclin (FAS1) repeats
MRGTLLARTGATGREGRKESSPDVKRTAAGRAVGVAAVWALVVGLGGCAAGAASEVGAPSSVPAAPGSPSATAAQQVTDRPFGTGCGDIPAAGEGSFAGMADDPAATAIANNPAVRNFAAALGAAHLGAPLNSQQDVTVLAPANAAFDAVPRDGLRKLMADTASLTAVLTHHVIQGRLTPDRLAGTHTTLNNDQVTIDVSPEAFSVAAGGTMLGAAPAHVICGNLQTANATIYIVDQVLTPPAA